MSQTQSGQAKTATIDKRIILAAEYFQKGADTLDHVQKAVKDGGAAVGYLAAQKAFRLDSLLAYMPQLNAAGTLRGMVVSAKWRHVYELSLTYRNTADKFLRPVGDFMGWASYIAGWASEIDRAVESNESWDVKGQRLCFYGTTALVQTLSGTAHGITDLMITGVEKSCRLGAKLGISGSTECADYADLLSASVAVTYKALDDATTPDALRATIIDKGADAIASVEGWYDDSVKTIRHRLK